MNSLTVNLHLLPALFFRPAEKGGPSSVAEPTFPLGSARPRHGGFRHHRLDLARASRQIEPRPASTCFVKRTSSPPLAEQASASPAPVIGRELPDGLASRPAAAAAPAARAALAGWDAGARGRQRRAAAARVGRRFRRVVHLQVP